MTMGPAEARSALQVASWRLRIRLRPEQDLIGLAVDALVAGLDGPALAELAGADARDSQDVRDLFEDVVREQGLEWPDEQSALWHLVRYTARQIVDGVLDPGAGAAWMWREASYRAEPEGDLRIFVGLASELEDHPDHRELFAREIVRESAELLARTEPRRWLRLQADAARPLSMSTTRGQAPVDLSGLGLSEALASRVSAWSDEWTDVLDRGGFASIAEAEGFVDVGRNVAEALQECLGPGWHVEYYPEPIRPPGVRLRTVSNSLVARAQRALRDRRPERARRRE